MQENKDLKEAIKALADVIELVDQFKTGVSLLKIVPGLMKAVGTLVDIKKGLEGGAMILPEFLALDDASRADLVAYVAEEVELSDKTAELMCERLLGALIALSAIFSTK